MTIEIVHGGQTGVDRGAHLAAVAAQATICGWMPRDGRDELGQIPADVARHLKLCRKPGMSARTEDNIEMAHALLVVVEDASRPDVTRGTALTLRLRRVQRPEMPFWVVGPSHGTAIVARWARWIDAHRSRAGLATTRLMVAGPRASLWSAGEAAAQRFVTAIFELEHTKG